MRPIVDTHITQHTIWHALTGEIPPLVLNPTPVGPAVLDSRDVRPGALFVALAGSQTDGHTYIPQSLDQGAHVVICEERGREAAQQAGATIVDCAQAPFSTRDLDLSAGKLPLVYLVPDSVEAIQRVGAFQRLHRTQPDLKVIAITGSVGKTSTKELAASVLARGYRTLHNPGNLNSEQGLPLTLLGLDPTYQRAVLEMGMYALGEIRRLCQLARPQVGVITNVGPSHLERLGTIERIAQAKSELVQALPSAEEGGVAILNWDDERVRAMASLTTANIFRYGLTAEADLWGDAVESAGMEGVRFRFHYRKPDTGETESLYVRVPLLGRHSVHTALCAAAVGLIEGLTWEEIVAGLQNITDHVRLVALPGIHGSTVIDDTYNASPASTLAALNLLADIQPQDSGRRIAVLGDMRELGSFTEEGHRTVGIRAAGVAQILLTIGALGRTIGEESLTAGFAADQLYMVPDADQAISLLWELIQPGDLILVKGSRAVGMERVATEICLAHHGLKSTAQPTTSHAGLSSKSANSESAH